LAQSPEIGDNAAMTRPSTRHSVLLRAIGAACLLAMTLLPATVRADDAAPSQKSFALRSFDRASRAAEEVFRNAQELGQFALGLIGVRYRYGGETPDNGLDCSGLIRYVFQQVTGVTLPRTAKELSQVGARVSLSDLQVGDLVFFNTRHFTFSHVGMYLGDDRFIHAPRRGRDVEISTLSKEYWQRHFTGARRLVGVLPALVPSVIAEASAEPLAPQQEPVTPFAQSLVDAIPETP